MDRKIVILTLSPAIDVYYKSNGEGDLPTELGRSSAGKGVNLARTLSVFGIECCCHLVLGKDNLDEYLSGLDKDSSVLYGYTPLDGSTRVNRHIRYPDGESVVSGEGIPLDSMALGEIFHSIGDGLCSGDVFCLSGSIPDGTDKSVLLRRMSELRRRGVTVAVDTRSLDAEELRKLHPSVIKPNRDEAEKLLLTLGACEFEALRALADTVLVTLGGEGAILLGEESLVCRPHTIEVRSSVGAGDSTLAAYLVSKLEGQSDRDALKLSVACGSASCMQKGASPPDPCKIKRLLECLTVEKI